MGSVESPQFKAELWAKIERLVYKPKTRLLKAHLEYNIRKLDDQTAQISAAGQLNIPFQNARQLEWTGQLTNGEPKVGDLPEVFLLPILLRSFFLEKTAGDIAFQIGGREFLLRIKPAREPGIFEVMAMRNNAGIVDSNKARSGRLVWDAKLGLISMIELEAPVVGRIQIVLETQESSN